MRDGSTTSASSYQAEGSNDTDGIGLVQPISGAIARIEQAIAKRKERVAELQSEMADLEKSLSALRLARSSLPSNAREPLGAPSVLPPPQAPRRINPESRAEAVRSAAEQILREEGRPMQRGELYSKVLSAGVSLPGDKPERKLSKIMTDAKDRFFSTKDGYWLKGSPLPEIGS